MKKIIIAIDGHSSTGKSTLAKQIAQAINYIYVDTGAMYRAVTLWAMQHNWVTEGFIDAQNIITHLNEVHLAFEKNPQNNQIEMYLNGSNVATAIRSIEVSRLVSPIAELSEVRSKLVQQQQQIGAQKGIVMDGRDIGTVVFPEAELKIFMTASAPVRAQRRYQEMIEKGENVSYEAILENVTQRDFIDSNRADSPLKKAEGAIVIDNSELTKEAQYAMVMQLISEKNNRL